MNRIVEIKELKKVVCAASVLVIAGAFYACSSSPQAQKSSDLQKDSWLGPISNSKSGLAIQKSWSRGLDGYITELSLSQQGNAILVSTLPDYDHEGGARKNLLRYFDGNGRHRWSEVMPTQVKSQALSRDGSLAIATTHEDQILAFNSKGEKLWTAHATCMPFVIESRKEILCYHDDDAEPLVAFDVFDWNGKLKRSFPIANDILALKISKDEQHVAMALTKGNVLVLGPDYEVEWAGHVTGEVVDLDVSSGPDPRLAVAYSGGMAKPQKIALTSTMKGGKLLSEASPKEQVSQIALSPDAASIFAYGNAGGGQYIGLFQGSPLQEIWHHGVESNSHYTQTLFVSSVALDAQSKSTVSALPNMSSKKPSANITQAIVGVEQVSAGSRQSEVVGLDQTGALLWRLPVSSSVDADEGAFLYAQSWAPGVAKLAIATDDRHFGVFQVTAK